MESPRKDIVSVVENGSANAETGTWLRASSGKLLPNPYRICLS